MDNEKTQATIIIEEDQGPMVKIPLEKFEALVRADTLLALLHAVKHSEKIKYPHGTYEDIIEAAPAVILPFVTEVPHE